MRAETIDAGIETLILETSSNKAGSTVSLTGQKIPETGYMVGGSVDSLIMEALMFTDSAHWRTTYRMIERYINQNFKNATDTDAFLGAWVDKDANRAYVDISLYYADKNQAMQDAKVWEEIAIWDLAAKAEIRVS